MTPAARVAAAIEVLDLILDGTSPEKALTGWGRRHRFAGSKDRAAIRDHVFGALRRRASFAWMGGAQTGRGIMLGATVFDGTIDEVFTGEGHAPAPRDPDEIGQDINDAPRHVALDMPEWMLPHFDAALGHQAEAALGVLQDRAGVFLRVNTAKATRDDAATILAQDGIATAPLDDIKTALQVIENERRVSQSIAYQTGVVELQDPSSQRAIEALDIRDGMRVLDYCAGGGGKSLAMAAKGARVTAHDIDPRRMIDIEPRAKRAGVHIETASTVALSNKDPFDLVLCDAPCSGSGTWRRTPAAKWDLTPERLNELTEMQDDVLSKGAKRVDVGGVLAYATCSVFDIENRDRINAFITENPEFKQVASFPTPPHAQGDGFYLCLLSREK